MSVNILKDNTLDIEITLIKKIRVEEGGEIVSKISEVVPIDLSAIINLSLHDSLIRHGYKGSITINNKANILDKVNITTGVPDGIYIDVKIVSKDLEGSNVTNLQHTINFLGLVKRTTAASANIEDNIVIFEFEESVIAEMRYTSWESITKDNAAFKAEMNVIELVDAFYEKALLEESSIDIITLPSNGDGGALASEKPSLSIPYDDNHEVTTEDGDERDSTVFDVFNRLLRKTSIGEGSEVSEYQMPIFRFINTPDGRRMQFSSIITDRHREFISAIETNTAGDDFADIYLEKFNIGPTSQAQGTVDKNTSWRNTLEAHNIVPPDTNTLRERRWCNCAITGSSKEDYDIGNTALEYILYADALTIFAQSILNLGEGGINLPLLNPNTLAQLLIFKKGDNEVNIPAIKNEALYKLISSFLLVNEQLHFTVPGKIYREPGKFIIVDTGDSVETAQDRLSQLWFVTSINHVIDNGEYTTEFACNRFFGGNDLSLIELYVTTAGESFRSNDGASRESLVQHAFNDAARSAGHPPPQGETGNLEELEQIEGGPISVADTLLPPLEGSDTDAIATSEDVDIPAGNDTDKNTSITNPANPGDINTITTTNTVNGVATTKTERIEPEKRGVTQQQRMEAEVEAARQLNLLIDRRDATGGAVYDDEARALEHKILKDRGVVTGDFDHDAYGPADERTYNPADYS
ncbi:hypothetical protein N9Z65_01150 [bacterium]|nr:hypothetical protein [bacterium]